LLQLLRREATTAYSIVSAGFGTARALEANDAAGPMTLSAVPATASSLEAPTAPGAGDGIPGGLAIGWPSSETSGMVVSRGVSWFAQGSGAAA
jgi:hypothetical protein